MFFLILFSIGKFLRFHGLNNFFSLVACLEPVLNLSRTHFKLELSIHRLSSCDLLGRDSLGNFWGSWAMQFPNENIANTMQLMQWHAEGNIIPHIHEVYSLDQTPKALEEMMARNVKGKLVVACH